MSAVYDATGRALTLGARLGRGGEGSVFALPDGRVVKLYANGGASHHGAKLLHLAAAEGEALHAAAAWPSALVYDAERRVAGFVMPRLEGFAPIASAANPAARKQTFPQANWGWLAHVGRNVAVAVQTVHDAGFVIGDLNESNVLVASDARVRLIDVDSFQVTARDGLFTCDVGTPMFQPPELQGRPFAGVARTPNGDRFGLAVLVFQLLFMGRHPWAGRWKSKGELSFENGDYIARLPFAYGADARKAGFEPPDDGVRLDWLTPPVAASFERAFARNSLEARPSGADWVRALEDFQSALIRCTSVQSHYYTGTMSGCPWCRLDRSGFLFFIIATPAVVRQALDIGELEEQLRAISALETLPAIPAPAAVEVRGEPVDRRLVRHARLWRGEIAAATAGAFAAAHWLVFTTAIVIMAVLLVALVLTRPPLTAVRVARRERLQEAEARYCDDLSAYETIAAASRIDARKSELADMLARYKALPAKYQAERQRLERDRYRLQLEAFLDRQLVEKAGLWKIGRRTNAALRAFGIETAGDVDLRLPAMEIPGLGNRKRESLAKWVAGLKRKFRYDPSLPLHPSILADLARREAAERSVLERHLRGGPQALARDAEATRRELGVLRSRLAGSARAYAQADADYEMFRRV